MILLLIIRYATQYLIFSYSLISMLGSLLFLCTAPLGVLRLASFTLNLSRPGKFSDGLILDQCRSYQILCLICEWSTKGEQGRLPLLQRDSSTSLHPSAVPFECTALRLHLAGTIGFRGHVIQAEAIANYLLPQNGM